MTFSLPGKFPFRSCFLPARQWNNLLQAVGEKSPLLAAIANNNERAVAVILDNFSEFASMPIFDDDKSKIQGSGLFLSEEELVHVTRLPAHAI